MLVQPEHVLLAEAHSLDYSGQKGRLATDPVLWVWYILGQLLLQCSERVVMTALASTMMGVQCELHSLMVGTTANLCLCQVSTRAVVGGHQWS